ncbi:MAG: leucine-rich repeat domain-containing protein [Bacteroidales bacterium]
MKKNVFILFALMLFGIGFSAQAQYSDFSAVNNGKTIYYKITSATPPYAVSVFLGDYSGAYIIPSNVTNNGITYNVTSIDDTAFISDNLTSIILPNTIDSIGLAAFINCTGLISITIPYSVTKIEDRAFYGCSNLTSITSEANIPPVLGTNVFNSVPTTIPVYIPCGTITQYQSATDWSNFTNYQNSAITTNIIDSVVQGNTYSQYGFNETTAGTYTQNLQTINGCDSIVILTLTVYTLTTPASFVMQNNPNYIELSWESNGSRYDIMRNNIFLASVTETTYQDNDVVLGNTYCYQVKAYADNISSELSEEVCQTFASLNDIENTTIQASLYPNPTTDKAILSVAGLVNDANVIVYDIMGRFIKTYKLNAGQKSLEIKLNGFASGIYNVNVINSDCNISKKLIVQ